MVINFCTIESVCDFLLVCHSNPWALGPILPHFRYIAGFFAPLFHLNFGGVVNGPDRRCWGQTEPNP